MRTKNNRANKKIMFTMVLLVCTVLGSVHGATYTCPSYDAIRSPSVASFDPLKYQGTWYMVATNEPTMPKSFCKCGTLNWTVTSNTTFSDHFMAKCGPIYLNIPLVGSLSANVSAPGFLHEGVSKTLTVPNMVFNITGDYEVACVYSCVWGGTFSYQLLARDPFLEPQSIRAYLDAANAMGVLDMQNMAVYNFTGCF